MKIFILENSIVLKSYYEQIPNKISEYTGCKVECIVKRREINVDLIEDEAEFYRIKNLIDTKGYKKYKDEKEMKFIELLKYNNETKDYKI
jgi:hypothetical protein